MNNNYDVIVIGGGPAGMIAAGRAAESGRKVLLLEKNNRPGKKLLITGGGRCNVTNMNTDLERIYGTGGKYLHTTFSQFSVQDALKFFHERGMDTKVENAGRIFPTSNKAQSVLDVLLHYLSEGKVEIQDNSEVSSITLTDGIFTISLKSDQSLTTTSCILATGGLSHPETGSTGEGFKWLENLGHTIIKNDFALVPITLSDKWVSRVAGLTLQDIKITVFLDGVKQFQEKGRILFTHFGISGPTVLNMSKKIGDLLLSGEVTIGADMFPKVDTGALRNQLNAVVQKDQNKMIKNVLGYIVPSSLAPIILELADVPGDTPNNNLVREARHKIVDTMKGLTLNVQSLMGADKAIISSGGVDKNEVDFKTMESKVIPKLYLVGDVLDIDRPSGGFSLQLCWTTGYVAGSNA